MDPTPANEATLVWTIRRVGIVNNLPLQDRAAPTSRTAVEQQLTSSLLFISQAHLHVHVDRKCRIVFVGGFVVANYYDVGVEFLKNALRLRLHLEV